MASSPRVTAVVVHHGDPAPTLRCLGSLGDLDEVILVDQPPRLAGDHPRVTTRLAPGANVGFAAACNLAVAAARAPFVLLLNNDAVLAPGAARALHDALPSLQPGHAGACLKLLAMDGRTLQSAGGLRFTADGIGFPHGFGEPDDGRHDAMPPEEVGVPSGAAALYRVEAWREAGGLPGDFFCYCEDGDLGLAMIGLGRHFAWLPQVRVLHELSSSTAAHSLFKAFHVERNHFATMLHAAPAPLLAALPLRTAARLLRTALDAARGRGAGAGFAQGNTVGQLAATVAKAWAGALAMAPAALARRRALLAKAPDAMARTGAFLASHRVPASVFSQSRDTDMVR